MTKRLSLAFVLLGLATLSVGNRVVNRTGGGGGFTPQWVEIIASGSTNANDTSSSTTLVWDEVTIPSGATSATKLGAYIRSYSFTETIYLSLYNGGGSEIATGSVSVTGIGWAEVTFASVGVSAGTYYIGKMYDGSAFAVGYDNANGTAHYATSQTAGNPASTLPTDEGPFTGTEAMRVWVE